MHLAAVFKGDNLSTIRSAEITAALCAATTIIRPQVGFTSDDVSTRLMRAGGGMDLFMACINIDTIRLVGRCHSNTMLRYLHTTAQTFAEGLAERMIQHGDYMFIPPTHRE